MYDELTNNLDPLIYDLASVFVAEHYSWELESVPIIHDLLEKHLATTEGSSTTQGDAKWLRGGLPFADDRAEQLVSPFVLLTLDAVVRELHHLGQTPDLSGIEDAIRGAAKAFGASSRLVGELARDLAPKLASAFAGDPTGTDTTDKVGGSGTASVSENRVVVARLAPGTPEVQTNPCDRADVEALLAETPYDVIVNELRHIVIVRPEGAEKEQSLGKIGRSLRVLLWLALTHVGRTFEFQDLRTRLGYGETLDETQFSQLVYQYRNRLRRLLGTGAVSLKKKRRPPVGRKSGAAPVGDTHATLIERMLTPGGVRTYHVPASGWTFCWVRSDSDVARSALLRTR